MATPPDETERLRRRLARSRAQARAVILFEHVWPALWPPFGVAGLFVLAALLQLPRLLPPLVHLALLGLTGAAILFLLLRGLRRMSRPDDVSADRRLELASGLRHRPLAALSDRPATQGGDALWRAHLARAAAEVRTLRAGMPRPGLAARDPRALRLGLVVTLIAALVVAGDDAPARIMDALSPPLPAAPPQPATEVQAWITPPAYTQMAPLFLRPATRAVSAPDGSVLTVSVTGASGSEAQTVPSVSLNGRSEPMKTLDAGSFQAERELHAGGRLSVKRGARELAGWELTVVAPQAPVAAWTEPPGPETQGTRTRLPWTASDEYGVTELRAELRLRERPDAAPVLVPIPLPGGAPKEGKGVMRQDLTANPWAGLPVEARLVARNAPGLTGESASANFTLPERVFHHPVARALIAIRKGLSLHPDDRPAALAGLDELLLHAPDTLAGDLGAFLNLDAIYYTLVRDHTDAAVPEVQASMWSLALHLEEGATDRSLRALEQAERAAREAMDRAARDPTDANRQDLDRKLSELEAAIERHMEALAEQARRDAAEIPFDPDAARMDARDMDRLAEQAREAARQGKMNQARDKMAELEAMLDQLKNARPGQPSDPKKAEQRQRGRQQMGAVQDMIGREGQLLDHAQSRAQPDPSQSGRYPFLPPSAQPQPQPQTKPQSGDTAARNADRRVQQALRRALGELMQRFGDLTGQIPDSLGQADSAMRDAGQALSQGRDADAGSAQQRAIEALQKGGREMGQQLARQFGRGQQGQSGEGEGEGEGDGSEGGGATGFSLQDGQGDGYGDQFGAPTPGSRPGRNARGDRRDPLGRQLGTGTGADQGEDGTHVPGEMERLRTQAIQEELRRRGAERDRPREELDYIDRLLKQF